MRPLFLWDIEEKDGSYVGFDIDLATAVFKLYGIDVEWQAIDWDMKKQN